MKIIVNPIDQSINPNDYKINQIIFHTRYEKENKNRVFLSSDPPHENLVVALRKIGIAGRSREYPKDRSGSRAV